MNDLDIDGALIAAYKSAGLALPTAYENQPFTPPTSGDWAALFQNPADTLGVSLGANAMDEQKGFLQIDFNTKQGTGRSVLLGYIEAMRQVFFIGAVFEKNGQRVRVEYTSRIGVREVDGWMRASIDINWMARAIRPGV